MPKQVLTRRNGQPQACEPCRKAKARCDHETPKCYRCVRRQFTCVYDPAPMTKSRIGPHTSASMKTHNKPQDLFPQSPSSSAHTSPSIQTPYQSATTTTTRGSIFRRPESSLGSTKFSATFSENQRQFGTAFADVTDDGEWAQGPHVRRSDALSPSQGVAHKQLQLGIDILSHFPTLRTQNILLETIEKYLPDPWTSPKMVSGCLSLIWSKHGSKFQPNRTREGLSAVAAEICANNETSFQLAGPYEWSNWFGGLDLRWEMVGILFTAFGTAFYHVQEYDPVFRLPEQQGRNRKTAATKMRECADDCVRMCEDTNANDILAVLLKNLARLDSVILGDESDSIMNRSGSTMNCIMTVGLHRLPNSPIVTPLSEYRARLNASAYYLDKHSSMFCARPPNLNRMYCTYQIPLDLSEDELYGGPEVFAAALDSLDANGWNTSGSIFTSTWSRARCYLIPFWEELLELTLGVNPQFSTHHINKTIEKLDKVEKSYPRQLQYKNIHEWSENGEYHAKEIYLVTRHYLDVNQCRFFFERLKVSRGLSGQRLMDIAQEQMTVLLSLWLNRDRLEHLNYAFEWLVVCYGIPSAGVLCLELLNSAKPAREGPALQFSRSDVIQSLSMFLGFLDWVRSTDANHDLCKKLRRVVKRIMDSVLDAPVLTRSEPSMQADQDVHRARENSLGDSLIDPLLVPMDGMDDLNWLHTIDWTQGDWLDFNQPPVPNTHETGGVEFSMQ